MIRPVPHRLQKRVEETGGKAPNGLPIFRVVRGCDRLTWIGGKWKIYDDNNNFLRDEVCVKQVLKYPEAKDRYILEMWCPPENYGTPEQWEATFTEWIDGHRIETLGEFPRQGEYELVRVIETPNTKSFVPLTEAICDSLVTTAKLNRELPERVKREAIKGRREKEEEERKQRLADRINDICVSPTMRNPHVICPDMKEVLQYGK